MRISIIFLLLFLSFSHLAQARELQVAVRIMSGRRSQPLVANAALWQLSTKIWRVKFAVESVLAVPLSS